MSLELQEIFLGERTVGGGGKEGPERDAGPSKPDASLTTVKEPEEDRQSLRLYVFQRTICPGR